MISEFLRSTHVVVFEGCAPRWAEGFLVFLSGSAKYLVSIVDITGEFEDLKVNEGFLVRLSEIHGVSSLFGRPRAICCTSVNWKARYCSHYFQCTSRHVIG